MSEADRQLAQRLLKLDNLPPEFKSSIPKILQLDPIYKVLLKQLPDLTDPVTTILGASGYATQAWVSSQGYETSSHAAATYETSSHASSTYETVSHASSTYETQSHASSTYETQSHASSTYETQAHAAATYEPIFLRDIQTSDQNSITTDTASQMSVSLTSGTWVLLMVALVESANAAISVPFALVASSSTTVNQFFYISPSASGSANNAGYSTDGAYSSIPSSAPAGVANTEQITFGVGLVKVSATRTLTPHFKSEDGVTAVQLHTGSSLIAIKIA